MHSDNCDKYFRPWDTETDTLKSPSLLSTNIVIKTDYLNCASEGDNECSPSPIVNEDFLSTGNLDRLSNFVMKATQEPNFNSCSRSSENSEKYDHLRRSNTDSSSSTSDTSHGSTSPPSALLASLPASSPTNYWAAIKNNSAVTQDMMSLSYAELYRRFTSIQVSPSYLQNMEEAVKLLQEQDAAKQMKKLRPKKFRCSHCQVAFSNNGQLKGHIRIHTGERPFKCDFENCGKSFTRNEELTRHKRIHTGDRPHVCNFCPKRFGRKDHLKKHTKTHFLRSGSFGFDESTSAFNIFRRQSGSLLPIMSSLPTLGPPAFVSPTMIPLSPSMVSSSTLMPSSLQPTFFPTPPMIPSSSFQSTMPITSTPTISVPKTSGLAVSQSSLFSESPTIILPSEFSSLPSPDRSSLPESPSLQPSSSSLSPMESAIDHQVNRSSTIDASNVRLTQWIW